MCPWTLAVHWELIQNQRFVKLVFFWIGLAAALVQTQFRKGIAEQNPRRCAERKNAPLSIGMAEAGKATKLSVWGPYGKTACSAAIQDCLAHCQAKSLTWSWTQLSAPQCTAEKKQKKTGEDGSEEVECTKAIGLGLSPLHTVALHEFRLVTGNITTVVNQSGVDIHKCYSLFCQ